MVASSLGKKRLLNDVNINIAGCESFQNMLMTQ
jgi:hypothetical protein